MFETEAVEKSGTLIHTLYASLRRHAVKHLFEALRYKPGGRGFDSRFITSFWPQYGPGVDSASNRKEYQEYFLGVKAARA